MIQQIFNELQTAEYERMILITQFIKHYNSLQNEYHIPYNHDDDVQAVDITNDMNEFIRLNQQNDHQVNNIAYIKYETFLGHPAYIHDKRSILSDDLKKSSIEKSLENEWHNIFDQILKNKKLKMIQISNLLQAKDGKLSFINVLKELSLKSSPNQANHNESEIIIHQTITCYLSTIHIYQTFSKICYQFLDVLSLPNEIELLFSLIKLADMFYMFDDDVAQDVAQDDVKVAEQEKEDDDVAQDVEEEEKEDDDDCKEAAEEEEEEDNENIKDKEAEKKVKNVEESKKKFFYLKN